MVNLMKSQLIAGIAGVTIVFGATGLSVIAAAEDDPAITACEAGLKSTLTDGMVYRRINAQLTGATVRIDYETKFKKDAAVPGSLTCKFRFIEEPIREVLESDESDVIRCWAPDSRRSAPCGHSIIAAPRTAGACVIQAI
jgi:hypothetical protein